MSYGIGWGEGDIPEGEYGLRPEENARILFDKITKLEGRDEAGVAQDISQFVEKCPNQFQYHFQGRYDFDTVAAARDAIDKHPQHSENIAEALKALGFDDFANELASARDYGRSAEEQSAANKMPAFLSLMAVGDAFGMKYEFVDHDIPVEAVRLHYGPHPTFKEYKTGHYTDDTQMSLANAELLLKKSPQKIKNDDFVKAWLQAFRRDPRLGYSKHMFQLLSENLSSEAFCARLDASKGTTGGALMRSAPFGLLPDIDVVKNLTIMQATITHNTLAGINSSLFAALSTHYLHHGGKIAHLENFLDAHLGENWCSERNGLTEDPNNGLQIASQVLQALKSSDRLSEILLAGVSQTRKADTDTVCALAMAISSRRRDVQDDLPPALREGLEKDRFGLNYLERQDVLLSEKFPRSQQYAAYQPS